jgi:hypothetical protein
MDVVWKVAAAILAIGVGYLAGTFLAILWLARREDRYDLWDEDEDW